MRACVCAFVHVNAYVRACGRARLSMRTCVHARMRVCLLGTRASRGLPLFSNYGNVLDQGKPSPFPNKQKIPKLLFEK